MFVERLRPWSPNLKFVHRIENKTRIKPQGKPTQFSRAIRPADAIQLACASVAATDLFVTNDNRLSGLVVSGVTFVTGIERVPY